MWQRLRGAQWTGSLAYESWPHVDEALLVEDEVEIPVQVNGKLAGRVTIARDASEGAVKKAAMADDAVRAKIAGKSVAKTIYVPRRMLNIVVKN